MEEADLKEMDKKGFRYCCYCATLTQNKCYTLVSGITIPMCKKCHNEVYNNKLKMNTGKIELN